MKRFAFIADNDLILPDSGNDDDWAAFQAAARQQSLAAAESAQAREDQAFIDAISVWTDDCEDD